MVRDRGDVARRQIPALGDHFAYFRMREVEQRALGGEVGNWRRQPPQVEYALIAGFRLNGQDQLADVVQQTGHESFIRRTANERSEEARRRCRGDRLPW